MDSTAYAYRGNVTQKLEYQSCSWFSCSWNTNITQTVYQGYVGHRLGVGIEPDPPCLAARRRRRRLPLGRLRGRTRSDMLARPDRVRLLEPLTRP